MHSESGLDARLRFALEQQAVDIGDIDTPPALLEVVDRSTRRTRRTRVGYALGGALAAAAAALVVSVIGPSGTPGRPAPATASPPTGTWQRTVTGTGQWSGRWSVTFAAGHVLRLITPARLSPDEGAPDGASYAVTDGALRLDAFSNGACLDQPAGSYRWTVDGDRLFLEVIADPCQERRDVFAGVWQQGT